MKTKIYFFFLQIALLTPLFTSAQEIPASTQPQPQIGMTVFNENSIHVENNSLSAINIFTVVVKTTETTVAVIAFHDTLTAPKKHPELDRSIASKKAPQPHKRMSIVVPEAHSQNTAKANISWGNSPLGNHFLLRDTNNGVAIVTTTNNKHQNKKLSVVSSECIPIALTAITFRLQKLGFPTHETISISSNYSKTSRIRPPPIV